MATVTFDHVTKAYADDAIAVNDLNLLIKDGEFLVLVGPSGCGKTTALRCLAGLEEITAGQIKIDARVVNRVPSKDRNIAMVFQSYALYPHMTVYDNLAFGLKLLKTPKQEIRRRVEDAAKILNLERFLDRKPRALSGGQRQRVALGRAIVREPAAFLMDEPLSNLDVKMGEQLLNLSGSRAKIAEQRHGKQLEIGFRPEDLEIANGTGDGAVSFPANVDVVEYLGNQELLHAQVEGNEIVALVASDRKVQVGDKVEFTIPNDKLHMFDPETEESLVP